MNQAMGFNVGDTVNYHDIINGPVSSSGHKILSFHILGHGECVAKLSDKRGVVSLKALTIRKEN